MRCALENVTFLSTCDFVLEFPLLLASVDLSDVGCPRIPKSKIKGSPSKVQGKRGGRQPAKVLFLYTQNQQMDGEARVKERERERKRERV